MSPGPLVVVGDSLLDVDLDGSSERLCPDAPVPVVDLARERVRPGGAALAALLAARAGVPVVLVTGVGSDDAGDTLLDLLGPELPVLAQPLRGRTVTKTRIRTGGAPLLRVDTGDGAAGSEPLSPAAVRALAGAGAVLVSDYGRGLTGLPELRDLLGRRPDGVPLVWDPHPRGSTPVPGTSLVTPNQAEADRAAAPPLAAGPDPHERGQLLRARWRCAAVAVTIGERGALLTATGPVTETIGVPHHLRGPAGAAPDACGAGDRFAAAAVEALRLGRPVREAVRTAVEQAAAFVLAGGASACSVAVEQPAALRGPVPQPVDLATMLERTRRTGGRVVATGGCFDLLHRGHVDLLDRARDLGDLLVVCLNSDDSVRRAKGPLRPVVGQDDRARVLSALAAVDAVAVFDEDTPAAVLERIRPDLWVKGADYTAQTLPEAEVVTRHGGQVVLLPILPGYSTTRMLESAQLTRMLSPAP